MKAWLRAARKALPSWWDLHVYGGAVVAAHGVGLAWEPGRWIVLGAFLCGLGLWFTERAEG